MAGAARYSSSLIHETDADNQKVLTLIWKSGLKSWRKRFARFKIKVRNGAYPAHLESLWLIIAVIIGCHFASFDVPTKLLTRIMLSMPK